MNSADHTAVFGLILAAVVQAVGIIIWGATLTQRVKQLEEVVGPLKAMPEKVARIEERLDSLLDQFRDLNASIRWMRDPAAETMINPHDRRK